MHENENDYITKGNWDSTGITLSFNIPQEDKDNPYILYPVYNISRRFEINGMEEDVNAILIFFKKRTDPGVTIRTANNEPLYSEKFIYNNFSQHGSISTIKLNPESKTLFVAFFHDNIFNDKYVEHFYKELPVFYNRADAITGKHFAENIDLKEISLIPRRAGMSIVRKS